MSIVVFCGPTIAAHEVRAIIPGADVRPPAARGDLLAAAMARPHAIGLIDGYFSRVPAVWHKEILWAMDQGVHVFGSASMGALRAAELWQFGMEGVGTVFEAFRRGDLIDDDEVAIVHASAEDRYRPLSEAMVNVRATVSAAVEAGVIRDAVGHALLAAAKGLHYTERTYETIAAATRSAVPRATDVEAFDSWRRNGRIDQKRSDAVAMLDRIAELGDGGWSPKTVDYAFAQSDAWEALFAAVAARARGCLTTHDGCEELVMDELLASGRASDALAGGMLRGLSLAQARRAGTAKLDPRAVEAAIEDLRRERSLLQPEAFDAWLRAQRLSEPELVPFFEREALVRAARALTSDPLLLAHVTDHLREQGDLGPLLARGEEKRARLARRGLETPHLADTGLDEPGLWRWFFVERLQRPVPEDLESHAKALRIDLHGLRQAAIREYLFTNALC